MKAGHGIKTEGGSHILGSTCLAVDLKVWGACRINILPGQARHYIKQSWARWALQQGGIQLVAAARDLQSRLSLHCETEPPSTTAT